MRVCVCLNGETLKSTRLPFLIRTVTDGCQEDRDGKVQNQKGKSETEIIHGCI